MSDEESKLAAAGYPRTVYSSATKGELRQGDLCYGYFHQLRARKDRPGPGSKEGRSFKLPYLGLFEDFPIEAGEAKLVLRLWAGWVMILDQTCEIVQEDPDDSRVIVAPIVFESTWPGTHWSQIRDGTAPGYYYLPPLSDEEKRRWSAPPGWLSGTPAAVALRSVCGVTKALARVPLFGLSPEMRGLLQARLVDFYSVRGWRRGRDLNDLVGMEIRTIWDTDEKFPGPGRLRKIGLTKTGGSDDEITVGLIFRP